MAGNQPPFKVKENVPLSRLQLDLVNPRHEALSDQEAAIAQLCRAEKVVALAQHIAAHGDTNPLDRIGVVEREDMPGYYTVVEGNRRACALMLLRDPTRAPDAAKQAKFADLAAKYKAPAKINVVVFRDRMAARPWLLTRHIGPKDGAGTRTWNATQKARFEGTNNPNLLAVAILDRAETGQWITRQERATIAPTTLTRYVSNPVVRAALGLGSRSELLFTHDPDEVDAALKQFINDAKPRPDGKTALVHSRSKAAERTEYARGLHTKRVAVQTALPQPVSPQAPATAAGPKKQRRPRHPNERPRVMDDQFVITYRDKVLQRLYAELRDVDPEDMAFAANYLLRALLERVMVLYARKYGRHQPKMTDQRLTAVCAELLSTQGAPEPEFKTVRVAASSPDNANSLDTLSAAVHGSHLPTRKSLIAVFDNWEPAIKLMLGRL